MSSRRYHGLLYGCLLLTCCARALAQQVVWRAEGDPKAITGLYGFEFLGDLNGDGYDDLGVLSMLWPKRATDIQILSGRDGKVLRQVRTPNDGYSYTLPQPVGDWNSDGVPDYAATLNNDVWPWNPDVIEIRSGRDDRILLTLQGPPYPTGFGTIATQVELDGDGKPDLIVASHNYDKLEQRWIAGYSNSGQLLWAIPQPWRFFNAGKVGDVDGDGRDDFGVWNSDSVANSVTILSGRNGKPLYVVRGDLPNDYLGSGWIIPCGDVDGDARDDFAVSSVGSWPALGVVKVFSGRTGKTLWTFRKAFGPNGSGFDFGTFMRSGQDLNQDGVNDLIVGCLKSIDQNRGTGGRAYVFSLRDGRELADVWPEHNGPFTYFGACVGMAAAHPGNPYPVFAIYERLFIAWPAAEGRITLYRLLRDGVEPYAQSCPGTLNQSPRAGITLSEDPKVGPRLTVSDAPPGATALLLLGMSRTQWGNVSLPLQLAPFGLPGCELATSIDAAVIVPTGKLGLNAGFGAFDVPLPLAQGPGGLRVNGQWLVLGPGATVGFTSALQWRH